MTSSPLPLSVLDTVPVWAGRTAADSLRDTVVLAQQADALGYLRYWLAEHHNTPALATSSPAVLIGHVAGVTSRLRVGSGGVMLPNHAPIAVAEQFGTLGTLHRGRIDLGIGRAPGTDPATAVALRRSAQPLSAQEFPRELAELIEYLRPRTSGEPAPAISAVPAPETQIPVWLLGSSPNSAQLAGHLGLPFAFAHHLAPTATAAALAAYRAAFQASAHLAEPYAIVAALVIAADTDERAEYLTGPMKVAFASAHDSYLAAFPTPGEAAGYAYSPHQRLVVESQFSHQLIGGPATLRDKLSDLLLATGADELMALTVINDHEERVHSYRLLMESAASVTRIASSQDVGAS